MLFSFPLEEFSHLKAKPSTNLLSTLCLNNIKHEFFYIYFFLDKMKNFMESHEGLLVLVGFSQLWLHHGDGFVKWWRSCSLWWSSDTEETAHSYFHALTECFFHMLYIFRTWYLFKCYNIKTDYLSKNILNVSCFLSCNKILHDLLHLQTWCRRRWRRQPENLLRKLKS